MDIFSKIMFKRMEVWVLLLLLPVGFAFTVAFGVLVRQELVGKRTLGPISEAALFLSEMHVLLARYLLQERALMSNPRFTDKAGFLGQAPDQPAYLLLSRYDGDLREGIVELVDLSDFRTLHTWNPDITAIMRQIDTSREEFARLPIDRSERRFVMQHPFMLEDGSLIFQDSHTPLIKIDFDSELVWMNQEDNFHHALERDHEGNFWVASSPFPYQVEARYVSEEFGVFYDNALTKVSPAGEILYQKSVTQILIDNGMTADAFGTGMDRFSSDPIHLNDIQPVLADGPHWQVGDLFFSARHQSKVYLYRPSTNEILWQSEGHMIMQHDVDILNDHQISIFNNNVLFTHEGEAMNGISEVVIYDFATDTYEKYFPESLKAEGVQTVTAGLSEILADGSLLVEEQNYGRVLFFDAGGDLRWEYVNQASDGRVYHVRWVRILHTPEQLAKVEALIQERGL